MELYLYDSKIENESDPTAALICHYPDHIENMINRLHYLSLRRASRDLLGNDDKETEIACIRTSKRVIQIFEIVNQIFAMIIVNIPKTPDSRPPITEAKTFGKLMKWATVQNAMDMIPILKQDEEYVAQAKELAEGMKHCYQTLFSGKMPNNEALILIFNEFVKSLNSGRITTKELHPVKISVIFQQIKSMFHQSFIVVQWIQFEDKIVTCDQDIWANYADLKWLAMTSKLMDLSWHCHESVRCVPKWTLKPGTVLWPLKGKSFTSTKKCSCVVTKAYVADTLRRNTIQVRSHNTPTSCQTLYMQKSLQCSYNIVLAQCYDYLTQDIIDALWLACLTKLGSLENSTNTSTGRHRKKNKK